MSKLSKTLGRLKKLKEEKESRYKISEDSALDQIVQILDYYDIPIERFEQSEKTEAAGDNLIDSLIGYFRTGQLEVKINENGILTFRGKKSPKISFKIKK